jgi:hypothetical protein
MSQIVQKDFFISYTSADSRWAEWIAWQLEEAGYSIILQAWDFRPGANFVSEMERAISNVKRTIAVLSPQYLNALYTQPEWAAAFKRDPKGEQGSLVPVRVEECEVTGLLGQIIHINLVGRDEVSASKILLAGVRHERAKPEMAPAFPERAQHTVSKQLSFPGDLPSIWNVPYPRDPLFVGHEQVLQELHSTLHTKHQAALTPPSAGSDQSHVGVTETAVEYSYRYQSDYHVILWAHANSRQTLLSDFVDIASLLNFPENNAQRQVDMVNAVKHWLETQTHWLIVLEDVQDLEVIQEFIPSLNRGSLLLTTRVPSVSHLFPRVEMDRMKPEEQAVSKEGNGHDEKDPPPQPQGKERESYIGSYQHMETFVRQQKEFDLALVRAMPGKGSYTKTYIHAKNKKVIARVLSSLADVCEACDLWWSAGGYQHGPACPIKRLAEEVWLIQHDECKIIDLWAYRHPTRERQYVLLHLAPQLPFGLYRGDANIDREEAGYYKGRYVTRGEYDDGYAEIDEEVIELQGVELRSRNLKDDFYVLVPKFSAYNQHANDQQTDEVYQTLRAAGKIDQSLLQPLERLERAWWMEW